MVRGLRALDTLSLGSNQIRILPGWIQELALLRHLDVSRQVMSSSYCIQDKQHLLRFFLDFRTYRDLLLAPCAYPQICFTPWQAANPAVTKSAAHLGGAAAAAAGGPQTLGLFTLWQLAMASVPLGAAAGGAFGLGSSSGGSQQLHLFGRCQDLPTEVSRSILR